MKNWKVKFKFGRIINIFKILPTIQIEYSEQKLATGFGIVLTWLKWGAGIRIFY